MNEKPLPDTTEHSKNKSEVSEVVITDAMIEAGEDVLLCELGGAVSSHWNPPDLAVLVYRAMEVVHQKERNPYAKQT